MRVATLLACLLPLTTMVVSGAERSVERQFLEFQQRFGKSYSSPQERAKRLQIFADNLQEYARHNSIKGVTWRKGVNKFSDITVEEFTSLGYVGGYINMAPSDVAAPALRAFNSTAKAVKLPDSVDWRERGAITPVKDQGHCGSCASHAAAEQLESYLQIETGKLRKLSAQQITSCVQNPYKCGGIGGCAGSIYQLGFQYAQMLGVTTESLYPYISGDTGKTEECLYDVNQHTPAVYVRGHETLPRNDPQAVMEHLAFKGPLAMSASATPMKDYVSGVFDGCSYQENINLNHALQMVGYGTDRIFGDYWLIRNSWGADYGEEGYIRVKREPFAVCGVDETPAAGLACEDDGIVVQKVCGMCGVLFDNSYPIGASATNGME